MLRLSQTDPGTVECAKTRNVKCFEKELHTRSGREAMEKREAAGLQTAERAPVCVRNGGPEGASCSEARIQIVFCFCRCRRSRNNRLSLTEQRAASSPPRARLHLIHSLSAAAPPRSFARSSFCGAGGPFVKQSRRGQSPSLSTVLFSLITLLGECSGLLLPSQRPISPAACSSLRVVVRDVAKRPPSPLPRRRFQPVGTFCRRYIPTRMLDVVTKIATSYVHFLKLTCFKDHFVFPVFGLSRLSVRNHKLMEFNGRRTSKQDWIYFPCTVTITH